MAEVTLPMRSPDRLTGQYSPRLEANIALAMLQIENSAVGTRVEVDLPGGSRAAKIVPKPFYDPAKNLPKG